MPLRSMTGFGRSQRLALGFDWDFDVRSVNHKGLEVRVSAPSWMGAVEPIVQDVIRRYAQRGRFTGALRVTRASGEGGDAAPMFDVAVAAQVHRQLEGLRQALQLEAPVTLEQVLAFGEVRRPVDESFDLAAAEPIIVGLAEEAMERLVVERDREGAALTEDFLYRLGRLAANVDAIEVEGPRIKEECFARLTERVADVVARHALGDIPDERLWQEVIVYADKADITEEITRARAHLESLIGLIGAFDPGQDGSVGKRLDFYFQELIRETNTMGSKSQSAAIAQRVIDNRSEIDRMREQVLNVE